MKKYWLICITALSFITNAQDIVPTAKPQFTAEDAEGIARYLQKTKDIKTAVNLTQTAWKMTTSFASDEQLTSQWEVALESETAALDVFPTINSHLTAGQFLIQFSNGMNLDSWRLIDLPIIAPLETDATKTSASDYFTFYVNLPIYWKQLMGKMSSDATWLKIPDYQVTNVENTKQTTQLYQILKLVQTEQPLAEIITGNQWSQPFNGIQTALLRAQFHTQNEHWLALFYDWLEIYQLSENNTQLLTSDQQNQFQQVINRTKSIWTSNQLTVEAIDQRIYPLMLLILEQLPEKFKNPDHFNETLNLLIFELIWEMDKAADYANHVLRQEIKNNLEICLNLSVEETPNPQPAIGEKQFKSCVSDFAKWGNQQSINAALSGKLLKLDGTLAWSRALELPHFQIINFLAASTQTDTECQNQIQLQPNPVEWILATESMAWFHDRWPGLMSDWTDKNELQSLNSTGSKIINKPTCLLASQTLNNQFETVKTKWLKLKAAINDQLKTYRDTHLSENSQVDFFQPVNQYTQLTPEGVTIQPCDVTKVCGTFIELPASTALLDLFPNHLKMAQQFGLGKLSLCYDQVEWINRQTEPTHLNNNSIANFTGQLSLQLKGKYQDETIFTKEVKGESRHLYLFGENSEEVLNMGCPLPIVGQQINTQLERGTFGLFPNRLTFLTAQRTNINTVINNNWTEGENWQSKFADENNTAILFYDEKSELKQQVNSAFLQHNNAVQQQIYRKLMYSNTARINDSALSLAVFEYLTERLLLNKMTQALFPQTYLKPEVRAALKGSQRLMDSSFFKSAFENQSNLLDMLNKGDELIHRHEKLWQQLNTPSVPGHISKTQHQLKQAIQFNH